MFYLLLSWFYCQRLKHYEIKHPSKIIYIWLLLYLLIFGTLVVIVRMNFTLFRIITFNRLIWNKQKEMGKLSKLLLKSIVFTALKAQDDPTFQVTSCNADVSSITLTGLHRYICLIPRMVWLAVLSARAACAALTLVWHSTSLPLSLFFIIQGRHMPQSHPWQCCH